MRLFFKKVKNIEQKLQNGRENSFRNRFERFCTFSSILSGIKWNLMPTDFTFCFTLCKRMRDWPAGRGWSVKGSRMIPACYFFSPYLLYGRNTIYSIHSKRSFFFECPVSEFEIISSSKFSKFAAECDWNSNSSQIRTKVGFFLKENWFFSKLGKGDNLTLCRRRIKRVYF